MNILPPQLWQSVPFADRDSWLDWLGHHQIWHQIHAEKSRTPMLTFDDLRKELLRHNGLHVGLAKAYGIPPATELTEFDLNDRGSYYSWMTTHALDSIRLTQAAGL